MPPKLFSIKDTAMDNANYAQLLEQLNRMPSHGLNDLNNAKLMNRIDTKFIMPSALLPKLFDVLDDDYSALQIGSARCFRYESTYFDTEDFRFYRMHHNGKLNRHKVRVRRYVDSDCQFLEVKLKNNKKRTIKKRIPIENYDLDNLQEHLAFLRSAKVPMAGQLQPCLHNKYQRIALANEARGERLTIDIKLANKVADDGEVQVPLDNIAIIELKQGRLDRSSPFFSVARDFRLRPSGFSKYCMGMTLALKDRFDWKHNRFKPVLRRLACNQQIRAV